MPSLSRNAVHNYDPNSVFHNQALNLPHLTTWIDELLNLSEKSLPVRSSPTTQQLVETLQRYDAVFRELIRQNTSVSVPITKLFGKVWGGTLNLMDYMIKSYHRYVTNTNHLQEQAQLLLKQRQAHVAEANVQKEEFELERTALRAQVRTLQAEVEAMGATQRGLERENTRLRGIIDTYIKSEDSNAGVWDILDSAGELANRQSQHNLNRSTDMDDDNNNGEDKTKGRRKENFDNAKKLGRNMNRLDIEMNEAIAVILKEEDRQRMLVSDLNLLMTKNKERMKLYAEQLGQRVIYVPPPEMVERGIQVDEKEKFAFVSDLIESPREEDIEIECPESHSEPFTASYLAIPFQIRGFMATFPHILRIPPISWVLQLIYAIYFDKIRVDREQITQNKPISPLGPHVYNYFLRQMGLHSLADVQVAQLVAALNHHYHNHRRVSLFCHQLGIGATNEMPELDTRDTQFIMQIIIELQKLGELQPERAPKGVTKSLVFRSDVLRSSVIHIIPIIFGHWLEDGGQDCIYKFKSLSSSGKGNKYIDIDEAIEVLLDLWCAVRLTWEDHLHYLFHEHCSTFTVLSEAQFANDAHQPERDSVLVSVNKSLCSDCSRRPMRLIQKKEVVVTHGDAAEQQPARGHSRPMQVGNPSKEPVVDALTQDDFFKVVKIINPHIDQRVLQSLYEDAVATGHESVNMVLQQMWVKMETRIDEKTYYLNNKTGRTQWTRPYYDRTFRSPQVELDALFATIIKADIFPQSPFLELLHLAPKDLWPNSDMLLKQMEARDYKAKEKELMRIQAIQDEKDRIEREKREKEEAIRAQAEEEERARKAAEEEENAKKKKKKKSMKRGSSFIGKPKVVKKTGVMGDDDGDILETPDASRPGTASGVGIDTDKETDDNIGNENKEKETIGNTTENITGSNEENVANTNTGDDDEDEENELEAAFESEMSFGGALLGGSGGIFSNAKEE